MLVPQWQGDTNIVGLQGCLFKASLKSLGFKLIMNVLMLYPPPHTTKQHLLERNSHRVWIGQTGGWGNRNDKTRKGHKLWLTMCSQIFSPTNVNANPLNILVHLQQQLLHNAYQFKLLLFSICNRLAII